MTYFNHSYSGLRRWAAVLVVAPGLMAGACGGAPDEAAGAAGGGRGGPGGMATPVEVLTLAERPIEQASEFVGTVRSRRSTNVQSQVEGFITRINVTSGDQVSPGTVLFEIDAVSQQAAVSALEQVRTAREADLAFAKQQAERARKLLAAGAMSQQEHDQAQTVQKTAEAQLKSIEEQIRQQRNELGYAKVTASTSGMIGDVPVRVGDRITRSTLLTTIEDNSGLELLVNIPVQEAVRLKPGLVVEILDGAGGVIATERITFISPSVDDSTQTVLVKTPLSAKPGTLRSDQFVRARLIWSTAPALTVPLVAVTRISGQFFAYVAEAGEGGALVARQRLVSVGALVGNDYLVLGGLKAGDRVIVAGIQKIGDGAPVSVGGGR
jgi:RND family efflux transporter MFP subunit